MSTEKISTEIKSNLLISSYQIGSEVKNIIGKTIEEANEYINNFENMINEKDYQKDILKDALCFDEIYKQADDLLYQAKRSGRNQVKVNED